MIHFKEINTNPKEFAGIMRNFMYAALALYLQGEDTETYKTEISNGHYWLTELLEQIDPVLKEKA